MDSELPRVWGSDFILFKSSSQGTSLMSFSEDTFNGAVNSCFISVLMLTFASRFSSGVSIFAILILQNILYGLINIDKE